MTTKMSTNGQARKSLGDQIERLDAMLDGLADGLNDAVAAAVKEVVGVAVQQALQVVLREVLSNPELLARIGSAALPVATPAPATVAEPKRTWKQRWASVRQALAACLTSARAACMRQLTSARVECSRRLQQACRCMVSVWQHVRMLAHFRNQVLVAVGVGMTVGAAAYFAGPWLGAAASGIGGFAGALSLQLGMAFRRVLVAVQAR